MGVEKKTEDPHPRPGKGGQHDTVKPFFTPHELKIISRLLNEWSDGYPGPPQAMINWNTRMRLLRQAVIGGGGRRQVVPSELLQHDYHAMLEVVKKLRSDHSIKYNQTRYSITYRINGTELSREISLAPAAVKLIDQSRNDKRTKHEGTTKRILSKRFGILDNQIKRQLNASSRLRKKDQPRSAQKLAVGVLFDLITSEQASKTTELQHLLIAHLAASGYKTISLYYLIECAQTLPQTAFISSPGGEYVDVICKAISPEPDKELMKCIRT